MFDPINISNELEKERCKDKSFSKDILKEVSSILIKEEKIELEIRQQLNNKNRSHEVRLNDIPGLDVERIFNEEQIKRICVKYRLRFLDTGSFKGEIPTEAIFEIKKLRKAFPDHQFENFRIIGPKALFKLSDRNADPVLFAELGNGLYYKIHQWGKDMSWFRSFLAYPLRGPLQMISLLMVFSLIFSTSVPYEWLQLPMGQSSFTIRGFLFMHSFIAFCGLAAFFCCSYNINFSGMEWKSKYFN